MNKLTKVLSVFIIAGVIGTGAAGIAGCKKDKGHTHSYSYTDNADGTHNGTCDCGKAPITNEAHVDADGNKVCDKCDAAITSGEEHTHKYTYTDNGDGTHKGVCACGKDTIASEAHAWGTDGKCTKCGAVKPSEGEEDKVESVSITGEATVKMGATLQFTATVTGTGNVAKTVNWSVENGTGEATISAEGLLTPVKEGKVTVKATSTADNTKSATKEITVTGLSDYEKLMARQDKLVLLDSSLAADTKMSVYESFVNKGIFTRNDIGGNYADDYVKIAEESGTKVVQQVSKGKNGGGKNVSTEIVFGPVGGVVEGYFTTKINKLTSTTSNQTPVKLLDYDGNSVFRLVTTAGNISYSADGVESTNVSAVKIEENKYIDVYFKLDLQTGKLTLKLNNTVVADDIQTQISSVAAIELSSSNSGDRLQTTKNIVVCGTEISLKTFSANRKAKLDEVYATYILNGEGATHTINGALVTAAYENGIAALESANSISAVNEAYTVAVANMAAVLSDAEIKSAQDEACAQLDRDYPATNYTKENLTDDPNFPAYPDSQYNNKAAYEAAISAAREAIATKLNRTDITEELAKQKLELDKIKTDSQVIQAKIAEAQHRIEVYRADEIEALKDGEFNATYLEIVRAKKEQGTELLPQWRTVAEINEKLAHLRERIDSLIATTEMTPEEAKQANKAELEEFVADKLSTFDSADTDDNEVIGLIEAAKQTGIAAIDQAETRGEANAQLIKARTTVAFIATRGEAVQRIKSYSADLKKDFYLAPALALFDAEAAKHIANAKAVEIPETTGEAWEEAFETANQAITDVRLAAKAALDGKIAEATELELEAREAWSGNAELDLNQSYDFTPDSIATKDKMNKDSFYEKYNLDWLGVAETNTGRVQQKSGYLNLYAGASNDMNTIMTVTTKTAAAELTITFTSANTKRYFIIKDADGNIVGDGAATTAGLPDGAYEQKNITGKPITLGEAGTYYIYFCTSETSIKEHKIGSIALKDKETKQISGVVNSLAAVKTGSDTVVTAEIELEDKTTTTVTLNASEYTVDGGKIIFGTGKTAADANKYNSCNVPE